MSRIPLLFFNALPEKPEMPHVMKYTSRSDEEVLRKDAFKDSRIKSNIATAISHNPVWTSRNSLNMGIAKTVGHNMRILIPD